jgi:hypothetical protein
MQRVLASLFCLSLAACASSEERVTSDEHATTDDRATSDADPMPLDPLAESGVVVHVVDARGEPVAGVEVRVPPGGYELSNVSEYSSAGKIGRVDRFGVVLDADQRGRVRIPGVAGEVTFVAQQGDRWGAATWADGDEGAVTIALERDEKLRVVCADAEGRPGTGAFVFISATDPRDPFESGGPVVWGQQVTSDDGTIDVPHAQYWRALQREGREVTIAALVWWGEEMLGDWQPRPFPTSADASVTIEVSALGWIDVRADASLVGAPGALRWLDPPLDPEEDPDDIPEFPIRAAPSWRMALPLGQRYEVVFQVPGFVDPRVAFDGPKTAGERALVVVDRLEPAAVVTGRLVDEAGLPLAGSSCTAWLERAGQRIEAESSDHADAEGRFAFELPPGVGGVLHVELDGSRRISDSPYTFAYGSSESFANASARPERLDAGETSIGDVVCAPVRASR